MYKLKKFIATFMVAVSATSLLTANVFAAPSFDNSFVVDVSPKPIKLHQEVTITVTTEDGSDILEALDDYQNIGYYITRNGNFVHYGRLNQESRVSAFTDNGSFLKVVLGADDDNNSDPDSLPLPVGEYSISFGESELSGKVNTVFAHANFTVFSPVIGPLAPTELLVIPEEVKAGAEAYVALFYDQELNHLANLPEGWDIAIKKEQKLNQFTNFWTTVKSVTRGGVSSFSEGVYSFEADINAGTYLVVLINEDNEAVSTANLTVKASTEVNVDPNDGPDLEPDVNPNMGGDVQADSDIPDLSFDLDSLVPDISDLPNIIDEVDARNNPVKACSDVNRDFWGYEILNELLKKDLYPLIVEAVEVKCRPETEVTREQFTYWLLKAYQPEVLEDAEVINGNYDFDESPFSDVDGTDPYDAYVILAYQLGIVNGNPDGTFRGDNAINRAEVLKILLRSSEIFMDTEVERDALGRAYAEFDPKEKFEDEDDNDWYTPYLHYAVAKEIIEGRRYNFNNQTIVRSDMNAAVKFGEAAKILYLAQELEANNEGSL